MKRVIYKVHIGTNKGLDRTRVYVNNKDTARKLTSGVDESLIIIIIIMYSHIAYRNMRQVTSDDIF